MRQFLTTYLNYQPTRGNFYLDIDCIMRREACQASVCGMKKWKLRLKLVMVASWAGFSQVLVRLSRPPFWISLSHKVPVRDGWEAARPFWKQLVLKTLLIITPAKLIYDIWWCHISCCSSQDLEVKVCMMPDEVVLEIFTKYIKLHSPLGVCFIYWRKHAHFWNISTKLLTKYYLPMFLKKITL